MAVDVSKQAYEALAEVIRKLLSNRDEAAQYAEDPKGYLAAEGVGDYDLAGIDLYQCVQYAANGPGVPAEAKQAVQNSYAGGGAGSNAGGATPPPPVAPPGAPAGDYIVQHLNHITQVSYKGDEYITQQLINYEHHDYSSHTNLQGVFYGDVDASTVTATNGGVASTGYGDVVAATGDGAVAAGGDISGAVNTGEFTGVQAGGNVENAQVGDGNTNLSDVKDSNVNLGKGDQYNVQNSDVSQSAFGGGNVHTSEVNINANDGSAVAFGDGAKAEGSQDDNSIEIHATDSIVQAGAGNHNVDQSVDNSRDDSNYNELNVSDSFNQDVQFNDSFNDAKDVELAVNTPQEHQVEEGPF